MSIRSEISPKNSLFPRSQNCGKMEIANRRYKFERRTKMKSFDRNYKLLDEMYRDELILSILVYTFFSRRFDLILPPVVKHSISAV